MSHRKVVELGFARECEPPRQFTSGRKRRPKGAKGLGVKFETALAIALGTRAVHGQWFDFTDLNGRGFAQTDLLLFHPEFVVCIEAKLGNVEQGQSQLRELYVPLLEWVYELPVRGIVAARYITALPPGTPIALDLAGAVNCAQGGQIPCLHWRERHPLAIPAWLGPQPYPRVRAMRISP